MSNLLAIFITPFHPAASTIPFRVIVCIFQAPLESQQNEGTGSVVILTGGGTSAFQTAARQFTPNALFKKIVDEMYTDEV